MTKNIVIGFLGCGNVGSGVWRLLEGFGGEIEHRAGLRFTVKKVLVRDLAKKRDIAFPDGVLTTNPDDVLCDPEIQIVVEFLGGEELAYQLMLRALNSGKTVVTANKVAFGKRNTASSTGRYNAIKPRLIGLSCSERMWPRIR